MTAPRTLLKLFSFGVTYCFINGSLQSKVLGRQFEFFAAKLELWQPSPDEDIMTSTGYCYSSAIHYRYFTKV